MIRASHASVQPTGVVARLLSWAGEADPALAESKLRAFRRFLLLYAATRSALWIPFLDREPGLFIAAALWLMLCAAFVFRPQTEHWAPRLALPALALATRTNLLRTPVIRSLPFSLQAQLESQ